MSHILHSIPIKKLAPGRSIVTGQKMKKTAIRDLENKDLMDPNKRYLAIKITKGSAFVDYIHPREDEYLKISVSFLDHRYSSELIPCSTDPVFDLSISFEVPGIDPLSLLNLKSPLIIVLQKQSREDRPVVISTEKVDWRDILSNNSLEIMREMQPIDLKHKGSLGVLTIEMDVHPYLSKDELLPVDRVNKQ